MYKSDMGSAGYVGWWVLKSLLFIAASFVFSLIFWLTKKWIDGKQKKKK